MGMKQDHSRIVLKKSRGLHTCLATLFMLMAGARRRLERRELRWAACALIVSGFLLGTAPIASGMTTGEGFVSGEDTCFSVTNSTYLNVTLCSSEVVNVTLESVPSVVSFTIEAIGNVTSTDITLSGFVPYRTYYRHEDGYLMKSFMADEVGNYSYLQDLLTPHHIFIGEKSGTKYIQDAPNGGDCHLIGIWDSLTKTCTLTGNINEMIVMDSNGLTLDGNGWSISGNIYYGVYASTKSDLKIENLVIDGPSYNIYLYRSSYSIVSGNTITGGTRGINLYYYSGSSTINSNTITGNYVGIGLYRSSSSTLTNNIVTGNRNNGITISNSIYSTLTSNTIADNDWYGLVLEYSRSSTLTTNTITNNKLGGITLHESSYSKLTSNIVTGQGITGAGISLSYSSSNILRNNIITGKRNFGVTGYYTQDIDTSNTVNGKPIYYWVGHSYETVPEDAGFVGIVNSHHITVEDITLSNNQMGVLFAYTANSIIRNVQTLNMDNGYSIYMHYSNSNTLTGNTALGNNRDDYGIYLYYSNSNTLTGNTATNYYYSSIRLYYSSYNTLTGNTVTNSNDGLRLLNSNSNTLTDNIVTENDNGISLYNSNSNTVASNTISRTIIANYGIALSHSNFNTLVNNNIIEIYDAIYLSQSNSNTINDNDITGYSGHIYLYISNSNTLMDNTIMNAGNIFLYSSSFNILTRNIIMSGDGHGIFLMYSSSNSLSENILTENIHAGITLSGSGSNTLIGNTATGNGDGISVSASNSNMIYYNNFVDNINQVFNSMSTNTWDNGAGEGNYWSDYNGLDDGSGGRIAGDSIGDTLIPHQGMDSYPLMHPYSITPVGIDVHVYAGEGVTISFSQVTEPGLTVVEKVSGSPPANFRLIPDQTYYSITSSANYLGSVSISILYDPSGLTLQQEMRLKLKYRDQTTNAWIDITTFIDTVNNIIQGETTHLSIFAIMLSLNDPPIPDSNGPYLAQEGTPIIFDASSSSDPDGDVLQYRWDFNSDGEWDTGRSTDPTATYTWFDDYFGIATVEVYDGEFIETHSSSVTVNNIPPSVQLVSLRPQGESENVFPPASNVLATFEFNGDVTDSSGNGRDATLLGGEFVQTEFGQGLHVYYQWDPIAMEVIPMGIDWSAYADLLSHPYTIEIVLTPFDIYMYQYKKIFGFDDANDNGWYYNWDWGFEVYPNPPIGDYRLWPERRHYLAMVSTNPSNIDFYYDGTLLGSTDASFTAPPTEAIFFRDDSDTSRYEQLDAIVEAVRISSTARSPMEIAVIKQRLSSIPSVVPVGTEVLLKGTFTDPGIADTHTAEWTIGSMLVPGTVDEMDGSGTVSDTYTFTNVGIYPITLKVTDDDGGFGTANTISGVAAMVVVYDTGTSVTGGGWFDSPEGAYLWGPYDTGKATFAFVAKYRKGATIPTGETEFRFNTADLSFHSESYDWLVCGGSKCKFKGQGTLTIKRKWGGPWDQEIKVRFMISAIDGDLPGGDGKDRFRIKIWDLYSDYYVYYDNMRGWDEEAEPPEIGGGSIVIHKG